MSKDIVKLFDKEFKEIRDIHASIKRAFVSSVHDAIRIGEILIKIRGACEHGQWEDLVADQLPFSLTSAKNYMTAWARREELKNGSTADLIQEIGWSAWAQNKQKPKEKQEVKMLEDKAPKPKLLTSVKSIEAEIVDDTPDDEFSYSQTYSVKKDKLCIDNEWWEDKILEVRDEVLDRADLGLLLQDEPFKHWTHAEITIRLYKEKRK